MSEAQAPRTIETALPNLGQYYGTTSYMRHKILPTMTKGLLLTDGLQYVAEEAGAYWLMDTILLKCKEWLLEGGGFCTLKLQVSEGSAVLRVEDGNYNLIHEEEIDFTDFPEPGLEFFLQETETSVGIEPVLMLKSEY